MYNPYSYPPFFDLRWETASASTLYEPRRVVQPNFQKSSSVQCEYCDVDQEPGGPCSSCGAPLPKVV